MQRRKDAKEVSAQTPLRLLPWGKNYRKRHIFCIVMVTIGFSPAVRLYDTQYPASG
jgi:hypothetical protein